MNWRKIFQMTSSKKRPDGELGLVLVVHRMQMVLQAYPDYRNSFFYFYNFTKFQFLRYEIFFFEFSRGDDQLSSNELKSPTRNETLLIWWLIIPIIRVIQQLFSKRVFEEKKIEEIKKNSVSKFSSVVGFKIFSTIFFIIFLRI